MGCDTEISLPVVGPHTLVGNLGGSCLTPALLPHSLTQNVPQMESSTLCSVQPHTPTHPRAPPRPPQASPLTAFPAAFKPHPLGPCFPHFLSTPKTRAKACPRGPCSSVPGPGAADAVLSRLGTLLASRAALSPGIHSSPASLPLPRAVLLWPGPTEATLSYSAPPHPLVWPSETPQRSHVSTLA